VNASETEHSFSLDSSDSRDTDALQALSSEKFKSSKKEKKQAEKRSKKEVEMKEKIDQLAHELQQLEEKKELLISKHSECEKDVEDCDDVKKIEDSPKFPELLECKKRFLEQREQCKGNRKEMATLIKCLQEKEEDGEKNFFSGIKNFFRKDEEDSEDDSENNSEEDPEEEGDVDDTDNSETAYIESMKLMMNQFAETQKETTKALIIAVGKNGDSEESEWAEGLDEEDEEEEEELGIRKLFNKTGMAGGGFLSFTTLIGCLSLGTIWEK